MGAKGGPRDTFLAALTGVALCLVATGCLRMSPGVMNVQLSTSSDIAGVRSTAPMAPSPIRSTERIFPAAPDTTPGPRRGPAKFRPQDVPEKWQHNLNLAPHMKPIPLGPLTPSNARKKGGRKRRR